MDSINGLYNDIYQKGQEIYNRICDLDTKMENLGIRNTEQLTERIENLEKQINKAEEYLLKIETFRKIAEEHIQSKNLLTIEAPEGYKVDLNRLRNWAMRIDPNSTDDSYARKVFAVAKCDECFLKRKKEEFQMKLSSLREEKENGVPAEIAELTKQREEYKTQLDDFIHGVQMQEFAQKVKSKNEESRFLVLPDIYSSGKKETDMYIPGAYGVPFDFGETYRSVLKSLLGKYYDEKGMRVYLPVENLSTDEEFAMTIQCAPSKKRLAVLDGGIRQLLMQIVDKSKVGTKKVYVIDAERQNSALIGGLRALEDTWILEHVPRNTEQITATLEKIISTFADIDEALESYDSVVQYNKQNPENKLERKVITLVGWPEAFDSKQREHIKRILNNYERYGISFIAVRLAQEDTEKKDLGLSEYAFESIVSVQMTPTDTRISLGKEVTYKFTWYQLEEELSIGYVDSLKGCEVVKESVGNDYTKRYDMEKVPAYTREYKKVEVPIGIDGKGQEHSIRFENENFATYLVGASRSGKSTLLHTLIAGLIRNYHPDNMELWLADFKQLEFKNYIEHLPPHVKYVLLDESEELVFDLIDKLTEKMMERQHLFGRLNIKRIDQVDVTLLEEPLPIIFVILDEFSIMSQSVSESDIYKLKLQNLLAKGAALGIRFLFASQTFTKGISGLTGTAKDQIQQRISMKASIKEIEETLELSPNLKTEQVRMWMDSLQPHYALVKQFNAAKEKLEVKRLHVMYFPDYDVRDRMIDNLREQVMHKTDKYIPEDVCSYVDKHPVLIDGNNYEAFEETKVKAYIDKISADTDSYNGDEIFVLPGTPRLMTSMKEMVLAPESRQNVLLIGDSSERASVTAVMKSFLKSFRLQGAETEIWAYEREKIYRTYKHTVWADEVITDNVGDICEQIHNLKKSIENKEELGKKLVILMGFSSICSDFELLPSVAQSTNTVDGNVKMASASTILVKEEEESEEDKALREEAYALAMQKMAENEAFTDDEFAEEEEGDFDWSFFGVTADKTEDENEAEENSELETDADNSDSKLYNAKNDLKYIIQHGSRMGVHFLLYLNAKVDLGATGLPIDLFKHRIGFRMSEDDSRAIYGKKTACEMPERVCLYSEQIETFSLRPYLHEGLSWDGWEVNENGKAFNLFSGKSE